REAVDQWNRLYTQHYDSLTLGVSVVEALLRLQQPRTALDDARALEKRFGDKPELRRLRFRAFSQLQQHTQAAHLGDSLEREDPTYRARLHRASRRRATAGRRYARRARTGRACGTPFSRRRASLSAVSAADGYRADGGAAPRIGALPRCPRTAAARGPRGPTNR
ncbi:MAG: hypothetical protein ACK55I_35265, partial [bacterium]